MAVSSCGTLGSGKQNNPEEVVIQTETKTVIEKEYLPGRTILQPYAPIPKKFPESVTHLSEEYLPVNSDNIGGIESVNVGVNWAEQYHDLGKIYINFYNWYQGLVDGQKESQQALDKADPKAPR